MKSSFFFINMKNSIRKNERSFLTFKKDFTGNYSENHLSKAAAYTVFCHAEIEAFLESWAQYFHDTAESLWKSGKHTKTLVHLCTFHKGRSPTESIPANDIWTAAITESLIVYKAIIAANNGIKENHISKLFSPIGFDVRNIDGVLISDLSSFASLRGGHAHKSRHTELLSTFDPFDRKLKVSNLLSSLFAFDQQLKEYSKLALS